ncbi:hypothetical protein E1A91_A13G146700v1 [Gossypium mustelinum]|uniref:Uncharacterized protein n=1 Tax=Gossypium mustelinum TaxID=34275 RepID=A0A5D2WIH8_GOSMU|nr:hypothetical protein E1A91_A13G146700v1 [Gossypium mustelinum]
MFWQNKLKKKKNLKVCSYLAATQPSFQHHDAFRSPFGFDFNEANRDPWLIRKVRRPVGAVVRGV